ncbi:MAG: M3 family oligoendopeptidase [Rhodospirillales bacterium]
MPRAAKSAAKAPARAAPPPKWSLDDLYAGPDDPKIDADLSAALKRAKALASRTRDRVKTMPAAETVKALKDLERVSEQAAAVSAYASLLFSADTGNPDTAAFQASVHERHAEIERHLTVFTLQIATAPEKTFKAWLKHPGCARYEPWLSFRRTFRAHQLSGELEDKLIEMTPVTGAWPRLFDETLSDMRFHMDGKKNPLTESEILNLMSSKKAAERKAAAKALARGLKSRERTFALILNTVAKDKNLNDVWRGYARPEAHMNKLNKIDDAVVDALAGAAQAAYPRVSHRYYRMKAEWLGAKRLDYWDRNAPLPGASDAGWTWDEARKTVLAAYGGFEPKMAEIAETFFKRRWIDADPRPGKDSGAFSHPVTPKTHPYILMNFHGKARDVMTLAHELGHGVHQMLARRQGYLLADTPLTTAETASVFGEMLTFRALLDAETNPKRRRFLLASKVEDMINTSIRQIAFHEFERRFHTARAERELTPKDIGDIWMEVQRESLGPALRFDDDYRVFWAYIPHFVHVPFYVYAYAFGDCLVNALYGVFQNGHPGFQAKYLKVLSAGGAEDYKTMLRPFGLDVYDPQFWAAGLSVIEGFVDELEALE